MIRKDLQASTLVELNWKNPVLDPYNTFMVKTYHLGISSEHRSSLMQDNIKSQILHEV